MCCAVRRSLVHVDALVDLRLVELLQLRLELFVLVRELVG